ncbi:MAG: hypothetical protein RIM99_07310 [Cyclobacteriaceae bacterium]
MKANEYKRRRGFYAQMGVDEEGLLVILVALVTVGFKTLRTA